MSRIFISYRRSDAGGHAGRVFDRLRDRFGEQNLFFDQDAIELGDHFPKRIEAEIKSAAVVLVIIGPDWLESLNERASSEKIDFVQREVSIAVDRKRKPDDEIELIPILFGDASIPKRDRLHDNLRDSVGPLFDYQALEFRGSQQDHDHQFEHLLARIAEVAGIAPRAPIIHAIEPSVLSIRAPATWLAVSGSAQPITLPPIDIDRIKRAFRPVSRMLLDWPQETAGHWIERPELTRLHELTTRSSPSVTALLGGPGEGKSAILARLGALLVEDGAVLLAIKADRIPRDVSSLRHLDDWIDCGAELASTLRRLAEECRVVLLIDQLDALGDLMDQHSGRLSALFRLVESVRDTPNLHVIVSCREFEFRHDVRLNTPQTERVTLERLPWDRVLPVLNARKIDTHRWGDEVRDVLRTPHNLAIYLELLAQDVPAPDFTSYQALLDRVIRERLERVHGDSTVQAAERIAAVMATDEESSIARARFSEIRGELDNIESSGLLVSSKNGLTVSFRHQTLSDVLRARSFLRGGSSLADYVIDRKHQSLLVRPTVWSTLNYLRASDTPTYRTEFLRLWRHPALRLHLRYLLIAFLGQVTAPTDEETGWLFSKLTDPDTRRRVLWAMAGNAAVWFTRLSDRLPQLMTEPPRQAWAIASLLAGAIDQHRDTVLALVQQHWMNSAPFLQHVLHVLCDLRSWDSEAMLVAFGCANRIVDQNTDDTFPIWRLMEAIARSSPDLSLKLLAHFLNVRTGPITSDSSDDGTESGSTQRAGKYNQLFRDTIWYQIGEMFASHPKEFIEHVWPWFIGVFERLGREHIPYCSAYRGHDGLTFSQVARKSDLFQKSIEQAMRGFAENLPDAYVAFVEANERSDLNVIHRLLALGLERIATKRPQAALRYLLGDPRRLAVGDIWDEQCASVALIASVVPALRTEDARRLEDTIAGWQYYSDDPAHSDPKRRLDDQNDSRERRLRLLRAFPFERLSPARQRHLRAEEHAFPDASRRDRSPVRMRRVDSPMSAAQMTDERDEDIVGLFETLTDSTERRHPTRGLADLVGGSVQASREFAEFAKTAPDRALRIIDRFEPGKTERPAGAALAALGESDVPVGPLIDFIRTLDARGFASEPFRLDAARCLREVARRNRGLDDETCHLLEGWITERPSAPGDGATDSDDTTRAADDSILWSQPGFGALPQGNYPILDALMLGHLLRKQPDLNGWLGVLERHLKRDEDPRVWRALARGMPYLVSADDERGIRFLGGLFVRHPTFLNSVAGVRLIAQIVDRLPTAMTDMIIEGWVSGDWVHGPQSGGEVAALNLCRNPESEVARERVEQFLSGDSLDPSVVEALRIGMTYTLAEAWHHAESRELSTPLLILLIDHARGTVAKALQSLFRRGSSLPVDVHTREVLEAVLKRPAVLVAQDVDFLVESLKGLIYDDGYPVLVHDVARALIEQAVQETGETDAVRGLSELADLALTLHRITKTREHGLDLFERLLKADVPGLSESLRVLDRPAFR